MDGRNFRGLGYLPIKISSLYCNGTETSILNCPSRRRSRCSNYYRDTYPASAICQRKCQLMHTFLHYSCYIPNYIDLILIFVTNGFDLGLQLFQVCLILVSGQMTSQKTFASVLSITNRESPKKPEAVSVATEH